MYSDNFLVYGRMLNSGDSEAERSPSTFENEYLAFLPRQC